MTHSLASRGIDVQRFGLLPVAFVRVRAAAAHRPTIVFLVPVGRLHWGLGRHLPQIADVERQSPDAARQRDDGGQPPSTRQPDRHRGPASGPKHGRIAVVGHLEEGPGLRRDRRIMPSRAITARRSSQEGAETHHAADEIDGQRIQAPRVRRDVTDVAQRPIAHQRGQAVVGEVDEAGVEDAARSRREQPDDQTDEKQGKERNRLQVHGREDRRNRHDRRRGRQALVQRRLDDAPEEMLLADRGSHRGQQQHDDQLPDGVGPQGLGGLGESLRAAGKLAVGESVQKTIVGPGQEHVSRVPGILDGPDQTKSHRERQDQQIETRAVPTIDRAEIDPRRQDHDEGQDQKNQPLQEDEDGLRAQDSVPLAAVSKEHDDQEAGTEVNGGDGA